MAASASRRNGNGSNRGKDFGKADLQPPIAEPEGAAVEPEPDRVPDARVVSAGMVAARTVRYLVAAAKHAAVGQDIDALVEVLEEMAEVKVVATLDATVPPGSWRPLCPPVAVVHTSAEQAVRLAESGRFHVEVDVPLAPAGLNPLHAFGPVHPGALPTADMHGVTVSVRDEQDRPVPAAAVYLLGGWAAMDVTDTEGRAVLKLPTQMLQSSTALVVRPASGHWSKVVTCPQLSAHGDNTITVQTLAASFEGFPQQPVVGWAAQALRVNRLPPTHRGHGVTAALIDSGIAATHPEFEGRIRHGVELCDDPAGWDIDTLGTATACAGIIAAADNGQGITGLAVDADVHAVKVLPHGTLSHLLRALDYCIANDVDVAQINATIAGHSPLLAAKLADAHNAGVIFVAPAGDTGGPVTVPAALPGVIAVGAAGRTGVFPADSIHATQLRPAHPGHDGQMPAVFTPYGPGVDVCAPGVAILTTAAGGGYTVGDGTAIAAAHITALVALMLAHHDDFRHAYAQRGPQRSRRLHQLLLDASHPINPGRGAVTTLPDACQALGIPTPFEQDWDSTVLNQLEIDLSRAGHLRGP